MKTTEDALQELNDMYGDEGGFLKMDGYDDCIIGVVTRFGQRAILCYDKEKVLCRLIQDGMTREDAVEFFECNQIGAWMGDLTPCFLSEMDVFADVQGNECDVEMKSLSCKDKLLIKTFCDKVENMAEEKMLKTGKLEGSHYAAMKQLRDKFCGDS